MPIPLNAKGIQREILAEVKSRQSILSSRGCVTKIGILLGGDGPSSQSYLRSIQKTFRDAEVGITVDVVRIPERTPVEAVLERIALLNSDPSISGILVLHPMSGFTPEEERWVFDAVDRHKDIDGMNSATIGLLALKEPKTIPLHRGRDHGLLMRSGIAVKGRTAWLAADQPQACRRDLRSLMPETRVSPVAMQECSEKELGRPRSAEIVVIALGELDLITKDMIGHGVAVITGGRITFDLADCRASHIALPSNVGTMAIAMLARHAMLAVESVFQAHRLSRKMAVPLERPIPPRAKRAAPAWRSPSCPRSRAARCGLHGSRQGRM